MKAVMQNFKTGKLSLTDVPPPKLIPSGVLVHNAASMISAGTEKAIIELAKMNPLEKARARPDLVKKVLAKAGQEGLIGTAQIVMNLVSTPLPLGYSCAGIVKEVGSEIADLKPGDRVACAGLGYANHAEAVFVPRNLTVPIPDGVDFDDASSVTIGAIAMQGIRQAKLEVGESVVVLGLGLIGQLAAQICTASGCRVFGIDLDPSKVELAKELGMHDGQALDGDDMITAVMDFTKGRGADAIIITAATKSSKPVELSADLARDRARVVAVGDVGTHIPRRPYYEKEIDFFLSRSYGPGRYDVAYEEKGHDYPIGYVRWTENRNMESFLELIGEGKIKVKPLVTHHFTIDDAEQAFKMLTDKKPEPYLGIVLRYDSDKEQPAGVILKDRARPAGKVEGKARIGIIGAGQFCQGVLLPKLAKVGGAEIAGVATGSGLTARSVADKYKCDLCTSDYHEILGRDDINAVLIATRHNLHAPIVIEALEAGKHVFVEKPLAMNEEELGRIVEAFEKAQVTVLTGFNRRFSPLAAKLGKTMGGGPLVMNYRINAGFIAPDFWHQDPEIGGGRIVGEVCHFIDVMQFLAGSNPVEVYAMALSGDNNLQADPDNLNIQIRFASGSIGTITYVANGDPGFPKERLTVFGGGRAALIDNWRNLEIRSGGKRSGKKAIMMAAKGHAEEMAAFVKGIRDGRSPITFESQVYTTQATFAIQRSLRTGRPVAVEPGGKVEEKD
jgi:predicted dehydrogenase